MDEVWLAEAEKKRRSWHSGVNLSLIAIRIKKEISRNCEHTFLKTGDLPHGYQHAIFGSQEIPPRD